MKNPLVKVVEKMGSLNEIVMDIGSQISLTPVRYTVANCVWLTANVVAAAGTITVSSLPDWIVKNPAEFSILIDVGSSEEEELYVSSFAIGTISGIITLTLAGNLAFNHAEGDPVLIKTPDSASMISKKYYVDSGSGSDTNPGTQASPFATIQKAIDMYKGKVVSACTIEVAAGDYDESLIINGISIPTIDDFIINGDARFCPGNPYVHGGSIVNGANRGNGACTLATGGGGGVSITITVTGATANPDFDADGIVSGDRILTWDGTNLTEYTVQSAANNVLTLTSVGAAPTLNVNGCAMVIEPNVRIIPSVPPTNVIYIGGGYCLLKGLYVYGGTFAALSVYGANNVRINLCVLNGVNALYANGGAIVTGYTTDPYTVFGSTNGIFADNFSMVNFRYCAAYGTTHAVYATSRSYVYMDYTSALLNSATGVYAYYGSYIRASSTSAINFGTLPYSPAVTDTLGNYMAGITFS